MARANASSGLVQASAVIASTCASANCWQHPLAPKNIRRPWEVFEQDLEDKIADALDYDQLPESDVLALHETGAKIGFKSLSKTERDKYAEISLLELSAFVCWRNLQQHLGVGPDAATIEAT